MSAARAAHPSRRAQGRAPQDEVEKARCSARITMMPPTCLRYSTGPRASAAGDMIAEAAAAAFFKLASSRLVPITARAAPSANSGVSDRLVRPIEQVETLPPALVSTTAAAAVA